MSMCQKTQKPCKIIQEHDYYDVIMPVKLDSYLINEDAQTLRTKFKQPYPNLISKSSCEEINVNIMSSSISSPTTISFINTDSRNSDMSSGVFSISSISRRSSLSVQYNNNQLQQQHHFIGFNDILTDCSTYAANLSIPVDILNDCNENYDSPKLLKSPPWSHSENDADRRPLHHNSSYLKERLPSISSHDPLDICSDNDVVPEIPDKTTKKSASLNSLLIRPLENTGFYNLFSRSPVTLCNEIHLFMDRLRNFEHTFSDVVEDVVEILGSYEEEEEDSTTIRAAKITLKYNSATLPLKVGDLKTRIKDDILSLIRFIRLFQKVFRSRRDEKNEEESLIVVDLIDKTVKELEGTVGIIEKSWELSLALRLHLAAQKRHRLGQNLNQGLSRNSALPTSNLLETSFKRADEVRKSLRNVVVRHLSSLNNGSEGIKGSTQKSARRISKFCVSPPASQPKCIESSLNWPLNIVKSRFPDTAIRHSVVGSPSSPSFQCLDLELLKTVLKACLIVKRIISDLFYSVGLNLAAFSKNLSKNAPVNLTESSDTIISRETSLMMMMKRSSTGSSLYYHNRPLPQIPVDGSPYEDQHGPESDSDPVNSDRPSSYLPNESDRNYFKEEFETLEDTKNCDSLWGQEADQSNRLRQIIGQVITVLAHSSIDFSSKLSGRSHLYRRENLITLQGLTISFRHSVLMFTRYLERTLPSTKSTLMHKNGHNDLTTKKHPTKGPQNSGGISIKEIASKFTRLRDGCLSSMEEDVEQLFLIVSSQLKNVLPSNADISSNFRSEIDGDTGEIEERFIEYLHDIWKLVTCICNAIHLTRRAICELQNGRHLIL